MPDRVLNLVILSAAVGLLSFVAFAAPTSTTVKESGELSRVCFPKNGHANKLTIAGTSQSLALTAGTAYLLTCDVDAWYEFGDGSAPTADTNSMPLWQKNSLYFGASSLSGQSNYIALLDQSTDGACWILECE